MMTSVLRMPLLAACLLAASLHAAAAPILEIRKTVERADISLSFSGILDGTDLGTYEEAGVYVTTPGIGNTGFKAFGNDPRTTGFHLADQGNESYTSIRGINDEVFMAADFLFGNGWRALLTHLRYSTYRDGVLVGEGSSILVSTTLRVIDPNGFDELRLSSHYKRPPATGGYQAIALDDLHLQLRDAPMAAPAALITEPGQIALVGAGLLALAAARRRFPL